MAAPGAGAGNEAAAVNALKGAMPLLMKLFTAFPVQSDDWKNFSDAMRSLQRIVGKELDDSAVPAAVRQMQLAGKGNPMRSAPPIAVQPNVKPPEEPEPV